MASEAETELEFRKNRGEKMSEKDIRWKQRFQNFEKAYMRLKEAMEMKELTELEKMD